MRASTALAVAAVLAAGCDTPPPKGTQIGAIREPDPAPAPPSDLKDLDLGAAVAEVLALAGHVTAANVFEGHAAAIARAERGCPAVWTGALPEDLVEIDFGDQEGLAWLDDCATGAGDTWHGFTWWQSALQADTGADPYGEPELGARSLVASAEVTDGAGGTLFAFDGEAADALGADGSYASSFAGTLAGGLVPGVGSGLRAQNNSASDDGGFVAEWSAAHFRLAGTLAVFDGFGPADRRDADAPELAGVTGWEAGAPRFTAVRYDLTWTPDCAEEPLGFVGIRGNEGFWFDVYFLPPYEEDASPAVVQAFPFEEIDGVACDGAGTLFSRNVDLQALAGDGWTPAVPVDVAAARAAWSAPDPEAYVSTLRQLPVADEPRR